MMRGASGMVPRVLQAILFIIIVFVVIIGLRNSREFTETVLTEHRSQSKLVGGHYHDVFSFHKIFNNTRFLPSKLSKHKHASPSAVPSPSIRPIPKFAKRITPRELLKRPLPLDRTRAPKLLHQSWKTDQLPAKFQQWSTTCRRKNPDWEYVLWTDKDNREIVKKYASWFLQTYNSLQSEIYRADAMRNIYMHVFGGVYADLDTECLRSYNSLFGEHNISTALYTDLQNVLPRNASDPRPSRKAFLGRMGADEEDAHSIPNAWMASTPGHPFWLLTTRRIHDHLHDGGMPELLTGPVSLRDTAKDYNTRYHSQNTNSLDEVYAQSEWAPLYPVEHQESLVLLPFYSVYPFSWSRDGDSFRVHCLVGSESFNSTRCKQVIGVKAWGSWSVTYWSHSWRSEGGQNVDNLLSDEQKAAKKEEEESKKAGKKPQKSKSKAMEAGTKGSMSTLTEMERLKKLKGLEEMDLITHDGEKNGPDGAADDEALLSETTFDDDLDEDYNEDNDEIEGSDLHDHKSPNDSVDQGDNTGKADRNGTTKPKVPVTLDETDTEDLLDEDSELGAPREAKKKGFKKLKDDAEVNKPAEDDAKEEAESTDEPGVDLSDDGHFKIDPINTPTDKKDQATSSSKSSEDPDLEIADEMKVEHEEWLDNLDEVFGTDDKEEGSEEKEEEKEKKADDGNDSDAFKDAKLSEADDAASSSSNDRFGEEVRAE